MLVEKNRGNILLNLALVLIALAAIGFLALQQFRPVARIKAANRQDAADAVTGTVTIDAQGGTRDLKSELPGRVVWCEAIAQSARFKKGDKLVELDSTDLRRDIETAKRNFEHASSLKRIRLTGGKPELLENLPPMSQAELERKFQGLSPLRREAERKLENYKRLLALNSVSQEDVRTAQRELDNIDMDLKQTVLDDKKAQADYDAAMQTMKAQLRKMTITAPANGRIDLPQTWEGALIGAGQVVATWFANERVVAAKISEESFSKVKLGQRARLRLLTYGESTFDAEVSAFHPKADEAQRFTVFLKVKVDRPEEVLLPNSTGEVTITIDTHPNALMVQRRALFDTDKVYVVNDGRVELRVVKVGFVALNVAEIVEGLKDGEFVIIDELDRFRDGQRVRVEIVK